MIFALLAWSAKAMKKPNWEVLSLLDVKLVSANTASRMEAILSEQILNHRISHFRPNQ